MFARFRSKTRPPARGDVPRRLAIVDAFELDDSADDLPCPWCRARTAESDSRCPSCGRAFGNLELQT